MQGNNNRFFYHDIYSRHNAKIAYVLKKLGHKGYACYFMLLEVLAASDGFTLDTKKEYIIDYLQDQLFLDNADEVKELLKVLENAELLVKNDGKIYSNVISEHMKKVSEISEIRANNRKGKTKKEQNDPPVKQQVQPDQRVSISKTDEYEGTFDHIDPAAPSTAAKIDPAVYEAFESAYTEIFEKLPTFDNHANEMEKNAFKALHELMKTDVFKPLDNYYELFTNYFYEATKKNSNPAFYVSTAYNIMVAGIKESSNEEIAKYANAFKPINNSKDKGVVYDELHKFN